MAKLTMYASSIQKRLLGFRRISNKYVGGEIQFHPMIAAP